MHFEQRTCDYFHCKGSHNEEEHAFVVAQLKVQEFQWRTDVARKIVVVVKFIVH